MGPMAPERRAAYLARLGLEPEPPSVDALRRLHQAHAEHVPYETLWIHLGEAWGIDPAESVLRLSTRRRGGYCFHLNGALGALLRALGYDVTGHVGGVHGPIGPATADLTNHLVLTVDGLPSDDNPGGRWYVDVGLGDALHAPLPLVAGVHHQAPFRLELEETPGGIGDWHLVHDPQGGFAGMAWRSARAEMDQFADRHRWLSTSPDSGFVRVLTVQRRDPTGVDVLRGLTLHRVGGADGPVTLESQDELLDVLGDLFGLDVAPVTAPARARLWERCATAHESWVAAGRP